MNLILIGAQGSGKGTQAQHLAQHLRLKPCASGELLRTAMKQGTPLGQAAKPYYDRGDLVPDALIIDMLLEAISAIDDERDANGIILDGFPRNVAQARALDERLAARQRAINWVVYLDVPRQMLLDRLEGRYVCRANEHVWNIKTNPPRTPGVCDLDGSELYQRADDTSEKIEHRLGIFFSETIRLTDYYGLQGKLLRVDGTGAIAEVSRAILVGIDSGSAERPVYQRMGWSDADNIAK
ncbi:MAG TPA: nucleoside monophosphate kinase [Ktedonobacterales bacterium]|jgi:adenylate kinase|nr:nucleoside monophosphate kinase [Ktedonobacterales bacterium]